MNPRIRPSVQALHPYTPGEQPTGADVLKLNTNENPYPPSPKVFEALAEVNGDVLRKYPHPTARPLCEAIARLHGVAPEQVIVGNGSDEILALCTRAFCAPGDLIGYLEPSYSLYPILTDIAGVGKRPYPLADDFTWTLPAHLPEQLFLLTQPNAPTSLALPLDQVRKAADACTGVFLVDEAYADFANETAVPLLETCPNLLISRTLSKSYSLAGIRLGYAVGPVDLIQALYKIKDSYNTDVVSQRIALAALEDQEWMRANVSAIRATRAQVTSALTTRRFSVLPSQTNFLFARVPDGVDARAVFEALRVRQIFVRYFPGSQTGNYLRITVGTDVEMDRFLQVLDEVMAG